LVYTKSWWWPGRARLSGARLADRRTPGGAALAWLVFGVTGAFGLRLQTLGLPTSSYVLQMAPYLIALPVLASLGRATRLPAAIGQSLE
jgi:general nucleoside transport system permease protein